MTGQPIASETLIAYAAGQFAEAAVRAGVAAPARLAPLKPPGDPGRLVEAIAAGGLARALLVAAAEWRLAAGADLGLGATGEHREDPALALVHRDRARATEAIDRVTFAKMRWTGASARTAAPAIASPVATLTADG